MRKLFIDLLLSNNKLTYRTQTNKMNVDLNNLPAGTYLIKVINAGNSYTEKIIVN